MKYELISSDQEVKHFIYLDVRLFRLLIGNEVFWNNFFLFFEINEPSLFYDFDIIFSWGQLLEERNLGDIITKIKTHPDWKPNPKDFDSDDINIINKCLDSYYNLACKIAATLPELQPPYLLSEIEKVISNAHPKAAPLIKSTLIKVKEFIENGNYLDDLSSRIAWALVTSHEFIQPTAIKQYKNRKTYFNPLIAGWYKLFISGNEVDFYRTIDRKYHADNLRHKNPISYKKTIPIKTNGDLIDSELIHYITLGVKQDNSNERRKVIAFTEDEIDVLEHRVGISKSMLIALQKTVAGWRVIPTPGEVISLKIKDKNIVSAHRIPFDTPFKTTGCTYIFYRLCKASIFLIIIFLFIYFY